MVKLSIIELEDALTMMVKLNQASREKLEKPAWWPIDYQFPLKRHPGIPRSNWRETLRNLISKCYKFTNPEQRLRPKVTTINRDRGNIVKRDSSKFLINSQKNNTVVSPSIENGQMRRDSTGSTSGGSTVSSISGGGSGGTSATPPAYQATNRDSSGDNSTARSELSAAAILAKNFGLLEQKKIPFVQVYDVCKVNLSSIKFDVKLECDSNLEVEKNDFMNYFGLDDNTTPAKKYNILPNVSNNIKTNSHHKNHLLNCPHIPFSSNVGQKLIEEWHNYESDVIEKRLERLERYLCNSDLPSLLTSTKEEFKVLNNKNSDPRAKLDHFYVFPTRNRHRKGKLTPKARHLLRNYCTPCSVNLSTCGQDKITNYLNSRKQKLLALIDLKEKENKSPFTLLESRVVLTPIDVKFKTSSSQSSQKSGQRSNFALQTLTPRNENVVVPTTQQKSPTSPTKVVVNFLNPSVVLHPIHELFDFTNRDKILRHEQRRRPAHNKVVNNRVVKNRVNVYNPRRFSTRLINV